MSAEDFKDYLIKAWKDAQIGGRMVGENAGVRGAEEKNTTEKLMLRSYIEGFADDQ